MVSPEAEQFRCSCVEDVTATTRDLAALWFICSLQLTPELFLNTKQHFIDISVLSN